MTPPRDISTELYLAEMSTAELRARMRHCNGQCVKQMAGLETIFDPRYWPDQLKRAETALDLRLSGKLMPPDRRELAKRRAM